MESNRFKESVHLFLHIKQAGDDHLKEFLGNKLRAAQDEIRELRRKEANLENVASQRMHEISNLSGQLN